MVTVANRQGREVTLLDSIILQERNQEGFNSVKSNKINIKVLGFVTWDRCLIIIAEVIYRSTIVNMIGFHHSMVKHRSNGSLSL